MINYEEKNKNYSIIIIESHTPAHTNIFKIVTILTDGGEERLRINYIKKSKKRKENRENNNIIYFHFLLKG